PSLGINCASCHTTEVRPMDGGAPVRLIGTTGHFDAEAFIGAVTVAELRTADPTNMTSFLRNVLAVTNPSPAATALLDRELEKQRAAIEAALAEDPSGAKGAAPGELHRISADELALDYGRLESGIDLARTTRGHMRLFHNMRVALHIPDQLPATLPPASGPGR